MKKQTFYVTTPIYYGTAKPHLGSLYSTLVADVISRWQKLVGSDTYFLTGTDEHGQKILQAAQQAGKTPKEFVDSFIEAYQTAWNTYHIEYQQFIRTTDPHHIKGVQDLIIKLLDQGDIYKGSYDGWYCTPCETFVTASKEKLACPSCGRDTVKVSEESYFFRLSAYQDKLRAFYKSHPEFIIPKERANEVLSFVEGGLSDLSISRTTISWGVPFPRDPEHVVYVWVDALCNYITAIGYGDPAEKEELKKWWPANVQVLGKDIIRFHAVYWPAMLMAAGLDVPKTLLVHGWIQVNKQKMSKSLGNVVDPIELAQHYGPEEVRYYLMRQMPMNSDGDFSTGDLEQKITTDLANDLGNLLNRMLVLADKNGMHKVEPSDIWSPRAMDLRDKSFDAIEEYRQHIAQYEFHIALGHLWRFINAINAYFHEMEPWKIVKQDKEQFAQVISATAHSLRIVAVLLWPIMPQKMEQLLESIGHPFNIETDLLDSLELDIWKQTFILKPIAPLFKKIEDSRMEEKQPSQKQETVDTTNCIGIEDLTKVELRIGTIKSAESIPESDKLIKMQVDLGPLGMRQILAGIRKSYHPEDLVGKQGLFVCNLKPRKMLGYESQGMMLVAEGIDGKVHPVNPEGMVSAGTPLR